MIIVKALKLARIKYNFQSCHNNEFKTGSVLNDGDLPFPTCRHISAHLQKKTYKNIVTKEKLLMSNFSFCHNVFNFFQSITYIFYIVFSSISAANVLYVGKD